MALATTQVLPLGPMTQEGLELQVTPQRLSQGACL